MPERHVVAVIGPGNDAAEHLLDPAYRVGRLLGERGIVMLNGGLDGVMAAASRGAREAGGTVIGLLPGHDRAAANPHLTMAVATGLGEARNALVVGSADGVIAIGGSWGTLSEIALARRMGKPVACLRGWHITDAGGSPVPLDVAGSPDEAVALIVEAIQGLR